MGGGAEQVIFPSHETDAPPQSVTHVRLPGKLLFEEMVYSFKTLFSPLLNFTDDSVRPREANDLSVVILPAGLGFSIW